MTKPNELTEEVLKSRLRRALEWAVEQPDLDVDAAFVDEAYERGKFSEFVGTVEAARKYEMNRCAGVARRLGHRVTAAQIIKEGKS